MNTDGYSAPQGLVTRRISAASDIWSLGMIFICNLFYKYEDPWLAIMQYDLYKNSPIKLSDNEIKNKDLKNLIEKMISYD